MSSMAAALRSSSNVTRASAASGRDRRRSLRLEAVEAARPPVDRVAAGEAGRIDGSPPSPACCGAAPGRALRPARP
jgi:hypothetical protein